MAERGRPRSFDVDEALDRAIEVFWRRGYEGTTLDDLTEAMSISRPSLYAAFGNKQETFKRAITRYAAIDMAYIDEALAQPTARAVAERYLQRTVEAVTQPERPPGCLSIQGGLSGRPEHQDVVRFLSDSRAVGEARFASRFEEAIAHGDLDRHDHPDELARYLASVASGIAVQAAAGATRDALHAVATRALASFPVGVAAPAR